MERINHIIWTGQHLEYFAKQADTKVLLFDVSVIIKVLSQASRFPTGE